MKMIDQICEDNEDMHDDSYEKIDHDTLILTDKLREVKSRIKKTPWYRIIQQFKLYKEIKKLEKQADDIGERLEKLEKNPVQIVKRT